MQSRSAAYLTIMANAAHTVEWQVTINGTVYGQDKLVYSAGGGNGAPRLTRQMFSGTQPEVGRAVSAQFTCAVMEAGSAIPRMAAVIPAYRLCLEGSTPSSWMTLGTFYIDTRQTDKVTGALLLTCYDRMLVADGAGGKSYADLTGFDEWPQTMAAVVNEIAGIMGISVDSRTTIRTGTGYNVEYPNDLTMREVLRQIAAAHAGNWCITPAGSLRLVPLTGTSDSLTVGPAATGLKVAPAMAAWTGATVYYADEEAFEAGTDTGRVLTCDCLWATQETANGIVSILSGSAYQPYTASGAIIDMALELGDSVTVGTTGQTVTGPVWSIDITGGLIEQADIAAPGEDEIDHEYPYASYVDRSLRRKVGLGQTYEGVSISRQYGLQIVGVTDGEETNRALLNSRQFTMDVKTPTGWEQQFFFDPERRAYVFKGALGADAIYADRGDIAELTVDRLSTSKKVRLYNLRNTGDDNFIYIQDNYQRLVTGSVKYDPEDPGVPLTEQATNRWGDPLYWQAVPDHINAQGYPEDADGNQIYATTEQPTPGEGETLDDYKVMVYQYTEQIKAQLAFELQDGVYIPKLILGAGDNLGRSKGFIFKDSASLLLRYLSSAGKNVDIVFSDDGFVDAMHRRLSAVALDTDNQTIIYTVEGSNSYHTLAYAISGDTITFTWPDGHTCDINIPDDGGGGGGGGGGGPAPSGSLPAMDGVASAGEFTMYSRGDHVHPTDTTRQALITASGILKGNGSGGVSAATPGTDYGTYSKPSGGIPASDLASGVIPSVPAASSSNPAMDGTASPGSSGSWARGDHVHPSDTSRVPTSRTINGYDLSADRSLTAADVGAEPTDSKILKNNAGNASSLSIMGGATPAAAGNMVAIGSDAWSGNSGDIAIGKSSRATGTTSMALGFQAVTTGANSIQLGAGTNADANTVKVGYRTLGTNYELLDANGIIPPGRMPVDAAPASGSDNLVTSGGIYTAIRERSPINDALWSGNTEVTSSGTTISLNSNWSDYSGLLIVLNTSSGGQSSSRMVVYLPTVALQFSGYYQTQNNAVSGTVRVGRPSGQIAQLVLYNINFTSLYVTSVYGVK